MMELTSMAAESTAAATVESAPVVAETMIVTAAFPWVLVAALVTALVTMMCLFLALLFRMSGKQFDMLSKKIDDLAKRMNEKFDKVDEKFDKIDERFDKIDERFDKMSERVGKLETRVEVIASHVVISGNMVLSNSPAQLSEAGKLISTTGRADDWARENVPALINRMEGKEEFEIYDMCVEYVENLYAEDENFYKIARNAAYRHNRTIEEARLVFQIVLRNHLLASKNTADPIPRSP